MIVKKSKVKAEKDFSYTNKFNNKKLRFTPKKDEVMASFKPDIDETGICDVMSAASMDMSQGIDLDRGFAVFHVGQQTDMQTATSALTSQSKIANTVPVMEDEEGLTRYFLPDEFDVQFTDRVSEQKAKEIIDDAGCEIVVKHRTPGYYTLTVPENKGLFEILREFSKMDDVAFAEPSEVGFDDELYLPDDGEFTKLLGLHNTGQTENGTNGIVDAHLDAPNAWDLEHGDRNVIVAVIDTGCDLDHTDLAPNLLPRGNEDWDFADPDDEVPEDSGSHGTNVAGTIAAIGNTGGVIGVAPRCCIMPLRINLTTGYNANRADAINYVTRQATANPSLRYIINCSWKMNGDHTGVHNAIINAVNNNVVVCFAAGNFGQNIDTTPMYPAVYPEVITVAATDQRDQRAIFSNYGTKVDVAAPGVSIYSSVPGNDYNYKNGTSMASPHVAGLAALIWSRNPDLSNTQVRELIENNCDNIDAKNNGYKGLLGKGRINAYRSVSRTPLPSIKYSIMRKYRFPQLNNGSSSDMTIARIRIGSWYRTVLAFLTQKPFSERIYYLHPYSGRVFRSIDPVKNDTIGSLAWDGRNIMAANVTTGSGSINIINPITGAQIDSLPVPAGRGEGLACDGRYLYYSTINRIHVIRCSDGRVLRSFPPPGGPCRALDYGRGYLFSGNSTSGKITVFDPNTLFIRGTISAPGGGSNQVEGLSFRASTNDLFVANQSENTIYVLRLAL